MSAGRFGSIAAGAEYILASMTITLNTDNADVTDSRGYLALLRPYQSAKIFERQDLGKQNKLFPTARNNATDKRNSYQLRCF